VPGDGDAYADGRARYAFICYARTDEGHVNLLQRDLEEADVSVWRDTKDLWPGDDWRAKIRQAIDRDAFVFIACFSQAALSREKSHQYDELLQAVDQLQERRIGDSWLFPVRFDDCKIPEYDLGGGRTLGWIQWSDLFGDQRDQEADRLVKAVSRELERRGPQAKPEPRAAGITPGSPAVGRGPDDPAARSPVRNRALIGVVALAVVAVVVLVVVLVRLGGTPVTAGTGASAATASPGVTTASPDITAGATASPVATTAAAASPGVSPVTARLYSAKGDEFNAPDAVAVAGGHVWVANFAGNSVTELNADNGSLVKVLPFANVTALAADGPHVFVGEAEGDGSVTELNATDGSVVWDKSVDNVPYNSPAAITAAGGDVWVANSENSVTELSEDNGSVVDSLTSSTYGFDGPDAIAVAGGHVLVANYSGDNVTEVNEGNGSLVKILFQYPEKFGGPVGIVAGGGRLWVADNLTQSLAELNEGDGSLVKMVPYSSYGGSLTKAFASDGTHLWVADINGSVAELNAANGSPVQVLAAGSHDLSGPAAIAAQGKDVWVANGNNSVTELVVS
jgi:hypothetical protein